MELDILAEMPNTRDRMPIYDHPPSAPYELSYRHPSLQYNLDSPPNASNSTMGPRRQSWQDLVAESETATVASDASVANYSFGEGSMGRRRGSWNNLIDSEDNLRKSPPKSNNKPKSYSSAGSLPIKKDLPESGSRTHFGNSPVNNRRKPSSPRFGTYNCPCSTKRSLVIILIGVILFTIAVLVGVLLRNNFVWPKIYRIKWKGGFQSQEDIVHLTLTVQNEERGMFKVNGFPFSHGLTYIDFKKQREVYIDETLERFCFTKHLNTTAIPDVRVLIEGAEKTLEVGDMGAQDWEEDWHWVAESLPDQFKEDIKISSDNDKRCVGDNNRLVWLRHEYDDQKSKRCNDCHKVCFPGYGVDRLQLKILNNRCFWLYIPEWSQHGDEFVNQQRFQNQHGRNPNRQGNNDADWLPVNSNFKGGRTLRMQPYTTPAPPPVQFVRQGSYVVENERYPNRKVNENRNNGMNRNRINDDEGWLPVKNSGNNGK